MPRPPQVLGMQCTTTLTVLQWSLSEGAGARKLAEVRTRAAVQLLLVQACGQVFHHHSSRMSQDATCALLQVVQQVAQHAREVDADMHLRQTLAEVQAQDKVSFSCLCSL